MKSQLALSVVSALSSSLCCITPVLTIAAGTGSLASSLHWVESLRPYFISVSLVALGFAWLQSFTGTKEEDCKCESSKKKSFLKSRIFLSVITIFSFLLIIFPSYSKFFLQNSIGQATQQKSKNKQIELTVTGMTCTSCELHIESAVKILPGVSFAKASYEKGSTTIEFDEQKVNTDKIIEAINATGYKIEQTANPSTLQAQAGSCGTNASCSAQVGRLPKEVSKNLRVISNVSEIQKAFNQLTGKTKFVAILSPTCDWCLQGAKSIQQAVLEKSNVHKDISVIIIWTNMLKTDDQSSASNAASLFNEKNVIQFFDLENEFGDVVAQRLNTQGKKAWDIYLFFDKDAQWSKELPKPFDYAHQLYSTANPWVDKTKYSCGPELTKRLGEIVTSI